MGSGSTPGALEELKRAQFEGRKRGEIGSTEFSKVECEHGSQEQDTQHVHFSDASQSLFAVFGGRQAVDPLHLCTSPPLSQRLRDLSARLSLLRLRCAHGPRGGSSRLPAPMWVPVLGQAQEGRHSTEDVCWQDPGSAGPARGEEREGRAGRRGAQGRDCDKGADGERNRAEAEGTPSRVSRVPLHMRRAPSGGGTRVDREGQDDRAEDGPGHRGGQRAPTPSWRRHGFTSRNRRTRWRR